MIYTVNNLNWLRWIFKMKALKSYNKSWNSLNRNVYGEEDWIGLVSKSCWTVRGVDWWVKIFGCSSEGNKKQRANK